MRLIDRVQMPSLSIVRQTMIHVNKRRSRWRIESKFQRADNWSTNKVHDTSVVEGNTRTKGREEERRRAEMPIEEERERDRKEARIEAAMRKAEKVRKK
ncbi:hypothetical protein ALC53_11111 [Atta colombica]|uniref:Uncharacterized protein n=1 Tax=Atta colombica TaxID=520822 RepID=A0A195B1V3_9HYME|nr:hypothetical protein ALC53_11111 [Atta colombica]